MLALPFATVVAQVKLTTNSFQLQPLVPVILATLRSRSEQFADFDYRLNSRLSNSQVSSLKTSLARGDCKDEQCRPSDLEGDKSRRQRLERLEETDTGNPQFQRPAFENTNEGPTPPPQPTLEELFSSFTPMDPSESPSLLPTSAVAEGTRSRLAQRLEEENTRARNVEEGASARSSFDLDSNSARINLDGTSARTFYIKLYK